MRQRTRVQQRIIPSFLSDGRGRAVAGKDLDVITQDKKTVAHAGNQLIVVSAGKVGPADGAGEQGVSHKEVLGGVKGNASQGMAGGVDHFQSNLPERDPVAVFQESVGRRGISTCMPQTAALAESWASRGASAR